MTRRTPYLQTVTIDGAKITDWPSFHAVFAQAFGFPDYYGATLDAWIDCMTRLDESDVNRVTVPPGGLVHLHLTGADHLAHVAPQVLAGLLEMAAFVNHRRVVGGLGPVLILSADA